MKSYCEVLLDIMCFVYCPPFSGSGESKESGTTEEKENQEIAEKKTELTEDPSVKS